MEGIPTIDYSTPYDLGPYAVNLREGKMFLFPGRPQFPHAPQGSSTRSPTNFLHTLDLANMPSAANAVTKTGIRTATTPFFHGSREDPEYGPCPGSRDHIKRVRDIQELKTTTGGGIPETILGVLIRCTGLMGNGTHRHGIKRSQGGIWIMPCWNCEGRAIRNSKSL